MPRVDDDLPTLKAMAPPSGIMGSPDGQGISEATIDPLTSSMPGTPRDLNVISVDTPRGLIASNERSNVLVIKQQDILPMFRSAGDSPAPAKDAPDNGLMIQTVPSISQDEEGSPVAAQDKDSIRALEDMIERLEKKRQDMVNQLDTESDGKKQDGSMPGKTQATSDDFPDFF